MDKSVKFHVSSVRWVVVGLFALLIAFNAQWHFDRMCAAVFSPRAVFTWQGVMCETSVMPMPLNELLQRHERVQKQIECMAANPDKKFMCDPRWVPAGDEESG